MLNLSKIFNVFRALVSAFSIKPYFGFIGGHNYLTDNELEKLQTFVGIYDSSIEETFEKTFSRIVGNGHSISFASARMGFYSLMQINGISKGDEVVLPGATCSVMVNAVLRLGAKPVFSDIDENNFGSSADGLEKVLSHRTRLIVAQHSFGIPCDIERIADIARNKKIFLLEDCALTLGSELNGIVCGNFGDAALFSTDHTKPINTISGGLIYTKNKKLFKDLKEIQSKCNSFSSQKQTSLWNQFLLERRYCNPQKNGKMRLAELISSKIFKNTRDAFEQFDYRSDIYFSQPYPARIPTFLAALGIHEVSRWKDKELIQRKNLKILVNFFDKFYKFNLQIYSDKSRKIVPLRFVFLDKKNEIKKKLRLLVDVESFWFTQPIVATNEPLKNFGYLKGDCPKSESIGQFVVNLPCHNSLDETNLLTSKISKLVGNYKS